MTDTADARAGRLGKLSREDFEGIERCAVPSTGSCAGMYTANTMSTSFEALGMSLLGSSTMANVDDEKRLSTIASARVLLSAIRADRKPSDIISRESIPAQTWKPRAWASSQQAAPNRIRTP